MTCSFFLWHVGDGRQAIKLELSLDGFSLSTFPLLAFFEAQLPPSLHLDSLVFQCFKGLLHLQTRREFLMFLPFRSFLGRLMKFI